MRPHQLRVHCVAYVACVRDPLLFGSVCKQQAIMKLTFKRAAKNMHAITGVLLNVKAAAACRISSRRMHLVLDKAYVGGEWIGAASGKCFEVTNPVDGGVIGKVPDMNGGDVVKAVGTAKRAFGEWGNTTAKERGALLRRWFELMVRNQEDLARIMTAESGKPLVESRGEVGYGNGFIEWYAEEARRIRGEIIPAPVNTKKILVERQAIGVAALITPWNFPHAMITRKAGAALAAGCTCVIKPAEDTPLTALALAKLAEEAGFPKGVINVVTCARGNAAEVGNILCTSDDIAGISFTGSTEVGKLLYKQCSSGIKRLGLELGGNAPFIVFNSADVDKAVMGAMASKFRNCGQTCVSANRFFVQSKIHDEFVAKFKAAISKLQLGDGTLENVTAGPLINRAQFSKVSEIVADAINHGAKVEIGGKPAADKGPLFYHPTMLTAVNEKMRVFNEEVFGPIATIIKFDAEDEAVRIANDTKRGLAGYFYSQDLGQVFRVARQLEVGMLGVNEGMISTPEAPFGGVKESGLGREGSHHGIEEYTYYKYICIGNL